MNRRQRRKAALYWGIAVLSWVLLEIVQEYHFLNIEPHTAGVGICCCLTFWAMLDWKAERNRPRDNRAIIEIAARGVAAALQARPPTGDDGERSRAVAQLTLLQGEFSPDGDGETETRRPA